MSQRRREGEFDRIARLARIFGRPKPPDLGIGDDAALLRPRAGWDFVWTVDTLVEGVHFRPEWLSSVELGCRAATAALSDIAAMGARPRAALVTFQIPRRLESKRIDGIARGIQREMSRFASLVYGGNLTRGPRLAIDITVIGEIERGRALLRSGVLPGDDLYVTGFPGAAALAEALLQKGFGERTIGLPVVQRWRRHHARCDEALRLRRFAGGCIDISDGLWADAEHLARASKVALHIDLTRLPTSVGMERAARFLGRTVSSFALDASDDYELLFSARRRHRKQIERDLRKVVTRIGFAKKSRRGEIHFTLGKVTTNVSLASRGWDHFS